MSKNSTVNLFGLLNKQERKEFAFVIEMDSNQRLGKLFLYLCENKNISSKENRGKLYTLLFGEAYSKKNDNKLRNEFRLLGDRIRRFMARQVFVKEISERASYCSLQYLDHLLSKKSYDLFESEAKRAVKNCLKESNFGLALQILQKYAMHLAHTRELSLVGFKEVRSMFLESRELSVKNYIHLSTKLESDIQYTNAILTALYDTKEDMDISDAKNYLKDFEFEDEYLLYMKLKSKAYKAAFKDKKAIYIKMLPLLSEIKKYNFNNQAEKAATLINIGMSYFMQNEAVKSLTYFKEGMDYIKYVLPHQKSAYIFNYFSALIKCERYELAVELSSKNEKILFASKTTFYRVLCLKAMAHLLLGDHKAAEKTMPKEFPKKNSPELSYIRLINCLIYFSRGDRPLALNECNNLIKTLKYSKILDEESYNACLFSREYFQICMKLTDKEERTQAFKQLKKKIDKYHEDYLIILPSKWVLQGIDRELG